MVRILSLAAVALLTACATLKNDLTVCPEYRDQRCAFGSECSMDKERGCKVCQCAPPAGTLIEPDKRLPEPHGGRGLQARP
jgi:hypothetical protein